MKTNECRMVTNIENKVIKNECRGCSLYYICIKGYTFKDTSKRCPCITCLVKMMCRFACEEYVKFRVELREEDKHIRKVRNQHEYK